MLYVYGMITRDCGVTSSASNGVEGVMVTLLDKNCVTAKDIKTYVPTPKIVFRPAKRPEVVINRRIRYKSFDIHSFMLFVA